MINFFWFFFVIISIGLRYTRFAVGDPGFPVGGMDPFRGVDLRRGCFLVKIHVKRKELGPVGGRRWAHPLDQPMICMKTITVGWSEEMTVS